MALTKRQANAQLKRELKKLKAAGFTDDQLKSYERGWRALDTPRSK